MFHIKIDGSQITEENLLGEGPMIRADVTFTAEGVPITGPPANPSRDEFVPDLCFKLLRSIPDIVESRPHGISFNSSVCEVTYEPATEKTVFVHAHHVTGGRLNDEVSEPGVEVPISAVVDEHLRVCEGCYRIYSDFPTVISRHPQIQCLRDRVLEECRRVGGRIQRELPELSVSDPPARADADGLPVTIEAIEDAPNRFPCDHHACVVLRTDDGDEFGAYDPRRSFSKDSIGTRREVTIVAYGAGDIRYAEPADRRIVPQTRGSKWRDHTYRGAVLDVDRCEKESVLRVDIGAGTITIVVPRPAVDVDEIVGETVSIRTETTEVLSE